MNTRAGRALWRSPLAQRCGYLGTSAKSIAPEPISALDVWAFAVPLLLWAYVTSVAFRHWHFRSEARDGNKA
jgi:hypothetical protein